MGYPSRWEAKCTSPHTSPELSWCWCCDVDADADVYSSAVGYLAGSSSVGVCMCVLHPRTWRLGAPSARFSPAPTQLKACQLMQATRCCPAASKYAGIYPAISNVSWTWSPHLLCPTISIVWRFITSSRSEHDQQIILAEGVALQQAPQLKPTSGISAHLRTSEAVLSALPILPTSSVDPSPLVCTSRLSISVDGGVGLSLLRGQGLT